jgi:hypothetical protein
LPIFDSSPESQEHDVRLRRGFLGLPRAQWFQGSTPGQHPLFQPLDFVWSLSKAESTH